MKRAIFFPTKVLRTSLSLFFAFALLFLCYSCQSEGSGGNSNEGQSNLNSSEYVNEEFRWKIIKPQNSKFEDMKKSLRDIDEGKELLEEENAGAITTDKSELLVTIRRSELGKIQVSKINHDEDLSLTWDDYLNTYRDFVYKNYSQLGFTVDSSSQVSQIDSVSFNSLTFSLLEPQSGVKMTHHIYKKYYPEKKAEFVINVTYGHSQDKYLLLRALGQSEFY
jgi:hypothetical protein